MAKSNSAAKYLSGRVKRRAQDKLSDDRYQYLGLEEAEPNLGDSPTVSGTPGVPSGQQFQLISVLNNPGDRYWIPIQGGLIPGSISVFEEGTLTGTLSSITQLNFVGNGVTAFAQPLSVAATITVKPPGIDGSILFKDNDDFATSVGLRYDDIDDIVSIGGGLSVGTNGGRLQVNNTGIGSVGIGSTNPTQKLHVDGNLRLTGSIYDKNNFKGNSQDIIVSTTNGIEWINQQAAITGAGGTISQVQYHGNAGLVAGATNFVYTSSSKRVGIGSTTPNALLDVRGTSVFKGSHTVDSFRNTGLSTFVGISTFEGVVYFGEDASFEDNKKLKFGENRELVIYHDPASGGDSYIQDVAAGDLLIQSNSAVKIEKYSSGADMAVFTPDAGVQLFWGGSEKLKTLDVGVDITGKLTTDELETDKLTIDGQLETLNLRVTGVATIGNIEIAGNNNNEITTIGGNLILDSSTGVTQMQDIVNIESTTQSNNVSSGALTVDGGVGIDKNLYVGGHTKITGFSTFVGVGTFGSNLWVGGNLNVAGDFVFDELDGRNINITGIGTINTFHNTGITTHESDVYFGYDKLLWDVSDNALEFEDNIKSTFGDSDDLQIYHQSSDNKSYINNTSAGDLIIKNGTDNIVAQNNSSTLLNFNGNQRLTTLTQGVDITGLLSVDGIDNDGHIETKTIRVSSGSTFNGNVDIGNAATDSITFTGRADSDLVPILNDNYDLGTNNLRWGTIWATTFNGRFQGTAETADSLTTSRNIAMSGDLTWDVDFNGTSDVTSGGTLATVNSNVGTFGSAENVGQFTVNNKGLITAAADVAINFSDAGVDRADKIGVGQTTYDQEHFLTFVDHNSTGSRPYKELYTEAAAKYNPDTRLVSFANIIVSSESTFNGNVDIGDNISDRLTITSRVDSSILPDTNSSTASDSNGRDIGGGSNYWRKMYAREFVGGVTGISTGADKILITSTTADHTYHIAFAAHTGTEHQYLYVDSNNLTWKADSNLLTVANIKPTTITDSGSSSGAAAYVPTADGSGGWTWQANSGGSADNLKTQSNSSSSSHYLTFVDSNNSSPAQESFYTDSSITYVPSTDKLTVPKAQISQLFDSGNSNGSTNFVPVSNGTTWTWQNVNATGGTTSISVVQQGRNSPCVLPITTSQTTGAATITVGNNSNAFGAKYIQTSEPTGSGICDGDIWYNTGSSVTETTGAVPVGGIIMWSGAVSSIGSGTLLNWRLCDGSGGRPDLRDRFVIGASGDTGTGYHPRDPGGNANAAVISHSHTASSSGGNHDHTYKRTVNFSSGGGDASNVRAPFQESNTSTTGSGSHSHTITVSTEGESATDRNLPPFLALAYIQRIS